MRPHFAILALLLAGTAWAGAARETPLTPAKNPLAIEVEGKRVVPRTSIQVVQPMEVRNLKFWDGTLEDTGTQVTIVVGELWNMTDRESWDVTIEIELHNPVNGLAKVHIDRPGKRVGVHFKALLPGCYHADWWRGGCRAWPVVRVSMKQL